MARLVVCRAFHGGVVAVDDLFLPLAERAHVPQHAAAPALVEQHAAQQLLAHARGHSRCAKVSLWAAFFLIDPSLFILTANPCSPPPAARVHASTRWCRYATPAEGLAEQIYSIFATLICTAGWRSSGHPQRRLEPLLFHPRRRSRHGLNPLKSILSQIRGDPDCVDFDG